MSNRNDLIQILSEEKTERSIVESLDVGSIIVPLIKMNKYALYLMAEPDDELESFVAYFHSLDISPEAIITTGSDLDSNKPIFDVPIYNYHAFNQNWIDPNTSFLVVLNQYTKGMEGMKVFSIVSQLGFRQVYFLRDLERNEICAISYKWSDGGRKKYYREHISEILNLYNALNDDESKEILVEYIRAYMSSGVYSLPMGKSMHKYFLGTKGEQIYLSVPHETWLNCGANKGDTIFNYFSIGETVRKLTS